MYSLDCKIKFGKYKGSTICSIIENDLNYITWCLENIKNFELDDEAEEYYDDACFGYG